jgi:hypothetical protein
MELLLHPFADKRSLLEPARCGNAAYRLTLLGTERHTNRGSELPTEHRLADFLELVIEIRNAVGVPEVSQLLDRIGGRDPHAFFQFAYRSFSDALISRAVIG